jgi:peptidyl-prolyl cis-trans isomerase B (cyclophilin B)
LAGNPERERRRARERYEQQRAARLERHRRNRKRAGIGVAVLCVLGLIAGVSVALIGGGGTSVAAPKSTAKATASASASATPTTSSTAAAVTEPAQHCTYTSDASGTVVKAGLPTASPDYKAAYTASINTNLGPIKIDLLNSKATCTVNSFVHLASDDFWNNTQCHRLSTTDGLYMLQCGDPTAKASEKLSCSSATLGSGGPGYEYASENLPTAASSTASVTYKAGTVAMANGGGATNGSQFFLVFKNTTLGPDYTPFGTITSGLNILQNVAKAGTSCTIPDVGGGVPKEKVIIDSVSIKKT